ncbi:type VII secretion protein EccB [Oryzihumus sp.]
MATKKDLVEAQSFSRRRLTTAFVSGAPGGREVEPQRPLRAVVGGIALSVLLGLGGLAAGALQPSLPDGWDDNSLVIAKASGARYVAIKQVLYPIINTSSARLLIPADSFKVVTVDDDKITRAPRGATIGILGAPDSLTPRERLVRTGWVSCAGRSGGVRTTLGSGVASTPARDNAVVVRIGGRLFVVTGGYRLPVAKGDGPGVLRALGLDGATPVEAPASWTNLFPSGPELSPLNLDGVGRSVSGLPHGATVGSVLAVATPGGDPRRYLVTPSGDLALLPPFAYALYQLGSGRGVGNDIAATPAEVGSLRTTDSSIVPPQWPEQVPKALDGVPCATLTAGPTTLPKVALSTAPSVATPAQGTLTTVEGGTGALVRAIGDNIINRGPVLAVDQTATAYSVEGGDDVLARLGYAKGDVTPVPQAWLELFRSGPTLSVKAASSAISTGR